MTIDQQIQRIQQKLQEHLKRYAAMQKTVAEQSVQLKKLQDEVEEKNKRIRALQEQQYILKSAAGQLNAEDKKAFEQAINKYIREIDKCISLLSE